MKWNKIYKNNLPEGIEVLAANFKRHTYGYAEKAIGYLYAAESGMICCENDNELLQNCTHYIDINKFDLKQQTTSHEDKD